MFTPFAFVKEEAAPITGHRYWRYTVGSAVVSHHPRVSRIDLLDASNNVYNIVTFNADNCDDIGSIPSTGAVYNKDFGAGNLVDAVNAQFYNTFGGGQRSANVTVSYSDDNITFTTAFSGVADSDARPTTPRCGLHTVV